MQNKGSYIQGCVVGVLSVFWGIVFILFPPLIVPVLIICGAILLLFFITSWLFQLPLPPSPFASSPADIAQDSSAATSPEDPPNKVRL